jgi:hypothetical protein
MLMGSNARWGRIQTRLHKYVGRFHQHPKSTLSWFVTLLAVLYATSLIFGLRHMNSDDNFYQLRAIPFFSEPVTLQSIFDTMTSKIRLRLFNTLIEHVMGSLQESAILYDVFNISSLVLCYAMLAWLVARLSSRATAQMLFVAVCMLFPLHFAYTIPQSYPVEFIWTLTCLWTSAILFDSYLLQPRRGVVTWGIVLFFLSLNGQEYNMVLSPLVVAHTIAIRVHMQRMVLPWRMIASLAGAIAGYLALFGANYAYHRVVLGRQSTQIALSLDLVAWLHAMGGHFRISVLPIGLLDGIRLHTKNPQFGFQFPNEFTYSTFFTGHQDWVSMGVVFICAGLVWFFMLSAVSLSRLQRVVLLGIGFSIMCVPAAVVATSKLYQKLFVTEIINGHVTSFHVHVGLSIIIVALASWVFHIRHHATVRMVGIVLVVTLLAAFQTIVFRYNTTNRQVMNYAMQRWDAIALVAKYQQTLPGRVDPLTLSSDTIFNRVGVAGAPNFPAGTPNYWTRYVQGIHGVPLTFVSQKSSSTDAHYPRFEYAVQTSGRPVSFLLDRCDQPDCVRFTVMRDEPIDTTVVIDRTTVLSVVGADWRCTEICFVVRDIATKGLQHPPAVRSPHVAESLLIQALRSPFGYLRADFGTNVAP